MEYCNFSHTFKVIPIKGKVTESKDIEVFDGLNYISWKIRCEFLYNEVEEKYDMFIMPVCDLSQFTKSIFTPKYIPTLGLYQMCLVEKYSTFIFDMNDKLYKPQINIEHARDIYKFYNRYAGMKTLQLEFNSFRMAQNSTQLLHISNLAQQREIYENSINADIKIKLNDGEIQVHSYILRAHSHVFDRMLESDMLERRTREIIIKDIDKATMDAIMRYLYFQCIKGIEENPTKVFIAADKYSIDSVMQISTELQVKYGINNDEEVTDLSSMFSKL